MSLEGQTFQFNMGATDPIPTKMDVSLDDMIKAVSISPARPSPPTASSIDLLGIPHAETLIVVIPCQKRIQQLFSGALYSTDFPGRTSFFYSRVYAGNQGGTRQEEGCRR